MAIQFVVKQVRRKVLIALRGTRSSRRPRTWSVRNKQERNHPSDPIRPASRHLNLHNRTHIWSGDCNNINPTSNQPTNQPTKQPTRAAQRATAIIKATAAVSDRASFRSKDIRIQEREDISHHHRSGYKLYREARTTEIGTVSLVIFWCVILFGLFGEID